MSFLVVPHQVSDTAAKIWAGALDETEARERYVRLELEGGEVEFLYEKLKRDDEWLPAYPEDLGWNKDPEKLAAERRKCWWFNESFSPRRAMLAIEEASRGKGRIRWITYRVPISNDREKEESDTLHLSLSPA